MAIDPRIALGVQPVQIENPLNKLAQVLQIKDAQTAGQMRSMQMSELQREATERNALNEAWRGAVGPDGMPDRNKLFQSLATGGMGAKIPGLQKQFLEADTAGATLKKTQTETQKSELEQALKKAEHASSVLSLAKDPQTYATVRAVVKSQFGQDLPEQFDPAMVQAIIAQGQTLTQRLAAEHQRLTLAETGRHNRSTEGLTARGQDITMRGQNLTDARSREATAVQRDGVQAQRDAARMQVLETPSGVVLVDKATGQSRPATMNGQPLPGKPSAATEKELVGIRQQNSIIDGAINAVDQTPSAFTFRRGAATMAGAIPESLAGRMDSDAERQARSYVFNNVSKVINERAGAAQSAQELARLRSFLPAETDSAPQIKSKLQAFKTYLRDMDAGTRGVSAPAGGATGDWGNDPLGLRK
jgi:hypothetical protein